MISRVTFPTILRDCICWTKFDEQDPKNPPWGVFKTTPSEADETGEGHLLPLSGGLLQSSGKNRVFSGQFATLCLLKTQRAVFCRPPLPNPSSQSFEILMFLLAGHAAVGFILTSPRQRICENSKYAKNARRFLVWLYISVTSLSEVSITGLNTNAYKSTPPISNRILQFEKAQEWERYFSFSSDE